MTARKLTSKTMMTGPMAMWEAGLADAIADIDMDEAQENDDYEGPDQEFEGGYNVMPEAVMAVVQPLQEAPQILRSPWNKPTVC